MFLNKLLSYIWVIHPKDEAPSATLTFAFIALLVCSIKFLLNGVSFTFNGHVINCGTVDSLSYAALLGPTVLAYVQRKNASQSNSAGSS